MSYEGDVANVCRDIVCHDTLLRSNSFMFLSYFRAALRLFPGCCFDYIMIFAKRKECFFVILHLCTISTKQCWFIRVFIAQKRHLYSFQRAIADFVCSHCPWVVSAETKSPAQGCNHSNKYPSITFKVLSAPSRWLRSYPCDAYTPAPISPWRMSYPARRGASTSDP